MMGVGVRRVVPLTLGWVDVPKSVSVDGASGEVLREPVPAVALDCDGGWLLLDTSAADSVARIRKLKRIAADGGYRLVPGHDPDVWRALTAELAAS